jgi:sugar phosphate isomerase/epimerase
MEHVELELLWDWFLDPDTDDRRRSDRWRRTLLEAAEVLGARHVKVGNFAGRRVPSTAGSWKRGPHSGLVAGSVLSAKMSVTRYADCGVTTWAGSGPSSAWS